MRPAIFGAHLFFIRLYLCEITALIILKEIRFFRNSILIICKRLQLLCDNQEIGETVSPIGPKSQYCAMNYDYLAGEIK